MTVPLFRVAMHPDAGARVAETLASGYVGEGKKVAEFEAAFGQLAGAPGVLAVNSCTAAIDLALHLCGVNIGSEVITTAMTCTATNGPIVNRGGTPIWADVDPITGLIDPQDVARKVTPRTKAVIAVDWGGRPCDYDALRRAAPGIPIIQDAAHRLYASNPGGDYVCFSHGPIKHLTCGGYGGSLLTPSSQRERARLLRWHGLDRESKADFRCDQDIHEAGYRYHLTDDLATVGLANLELATANVREAVRNADYYNHALRDLPGITLQPMCWESDAWLYTLLADDRDGLMAALADEGIASSPVHARNDKHPAFNFPNGPLPGLDSFSAHELAIPVGWWVTPEARERIASTISAFAARQMAYA